VFCTNVRELLSRRGMAYVVIVGFDQKRLEALRG